MPEADCRTHPNVFPSPPICLDTIKQRVYNPVFPSGARGETARAQVYAHQITLEYDPFSPESLPRDIPKILRTGTLTLWQTYDQMEQGEFSHFHLTLATDPLLNGVASVEETLIALEGALRPRLLVNDHQLQLRGWDIRDLVTLKPKEPLKLSDELTAVQSFSGDWQEGDAGTPFRVITDGEEGPLCEIKVGDTSLADGGRSNIIYGLQLNSLNFTDLRNKTAQTIEKSLKKGYRYFNPSIFDSIFYSYIRLEGSFVGRRC